MLKKIGNRYLIVSLVLLIVFILIYYKYSIYVREVDYEFNLSQIANQARMAKPFNQVASYLTLNSDDTDKAAKDPTDYHVTIVTQYFKLSNSKHGHKNYLKWMQNFFSSITNAPIIVYTDNNSFPELNKIASEAEKSWLIRFVIIDNIWSVIKQLELDRQRTYTNNYLYTQTALDPEKYLHNVNLYAIWNAKAFLMNHTVTNNW